MPKSVYYLAYGKYRENVKGAILLCPISSCAVAVKKYGVKKRATGLVRQMVRTCKQRDILPLSLWPGYDNAQRFLSLYTPNGTEEIFLM